MAIVLTASGIYTLNDGDFAHHPGIIVFDPHVLVAFAVPPGGVTPPP